MLATRQHQWSLVFHSICSPQVLFHWNQFPFLAPVRHVRQEPILTDIASRDSRAQSTMPPNLYDATISSGRLPVTSDGRLPATSDCRLPATSDCRLSIIASLRLPVISDRRLAAISNGLTRTNYTPLRRFPTDDVGGAGSVSTIDHIAIRKLDFASAINHVCFFDLTHEPPG